MSGRLAAYADEIERLLRFPGAAGPADDDRDEVRGARARRETSDYLAMGVYKAGGHAARTIVSGAGSKGGAGIGQSPKVGQGRAANLAAATGGAGVASRPYADSRTASAGVSTGPSLADKEAIAIYAALVGPFEREEEESPRRDGGGRRGDVPLATVTPIPARQGRAVAARAASAAGAQPAVFKVLSSVANGKQASALMQYIGTRENDKDGKHDIDVFTDDGHVLTNAQERRVFLQAFSETFRPELENTNFIEVRFVLAGNVSDEALAAGMNAAFGSKPFLFARDGRTVRAYAHTDDRAAPIAKVLAGGRENSRGKALDKIEARLRDGFERAGIAATVEVTAAVGNERQAKYFLQKFIRSHKDARQASGEAVAGARQPAKAATAVYEQWRPHLSGRERRNAYHLLFSAKAGTDANAVMAAARAVLEERAAGHKFVLAHHAETKHVHVHAMVQARSAEGERLKFYKPDLVAWREAFAEKARENSIAMVATRRMDHAMSRPFTKEHAGAYKRALSDPRYQVSAKTVERVENKRQRRIERQTLVANGQAIAGAWTQTAAAMRAAGVSGPAVATAEAIGNTVLQFQKGPREKGAAVPVAARSAGGDRPEPFLTHPGMRKLNALIGATEMAQTPLEMRQKMDRVNKAFDSMRETLPETEQGRFEQYRESVNDKMHDRLARLQFEAVQHRRGETSGGGEPTPEREARGRDLPAREEARQPDTPHREADAARSRQHQQQDRNREKARQAEEQDRRTQRSNDNDYER